MSEENLTMNIEETDQEDREKTPEPAETKTYPPITLNGLNNMKKLVEIAIKRGAYLPSEIKLVGTIYDDFSLGLEGISASNVKKV